MGMEAGNCSQGTQDRSARREAVDLHPVLHVRADVRSAVLNVQSSLGQRPSSLHRLAIKYTLDRTIAALLLVLLAPLLLVLAVAIRLDSSGPVLFMQRRHGYNGQVFAIRKFRTMRWEGGAGDGRVQTKRRDCRVTRVGGLLRRTSLDELPQLWNILTGTMSLVGPRPHPVAMRTEGKLCEDIEPAYAERHRVKPGITGLAQINGHRGPTETVAQLRARLADDLRYIERWSLLLDLRILLLTPIRLVVHREAAY